MTSPEFTRNRDNYCYRHPDRQSFVLCQRCLRTVCPQCQTPAAVGVLCPDCMKQQSNRTPAQRKAERRWHGGGAAVVPRSGFRALRVTYVILAITVVTSLVQMIPGPIGSGVTNALLFAGVYIDPGSGSALEPWRALTVVLVHGGILHLALNMLSLWMMGRILEPILGSVRFGTLYVLSALTGSVLTALIDPMLPVVGASGAIFGTFGALFIIARSFGGNVRSIVVIVGINLVYSFLVPGIAWQAHIGGLLGGAVVAFIYVATRGRAKRPMQIGLLVGFVVVLVLLSLLVPVLHPVLVG